MCSSFVALRPNDVPRQVPVGTFGMTKTPGSAEPARGSWGYTVDQRVTPLR